jgi:hypothetical protein
MNTAELNLHAEELDAFDAPAWDWGNFFTGVGVGLTLVSIAVGVALT